MRFLIIVLVLMYSIFGWNQVGISPFNQVGISPKDSLSYRVTISGHFHGSGSNKTGYPANTLLANINQLNQSSDFVICLGDLFLDISNDIPFYENSFFSKLKTPLFNAVGNHDITKDIYQTNFGNTYFKFILNKDVHLFFDTELNDGSIKNEQLKLLKNIELLIDNNEINQVFIYSHRTVWAKHYSELDLLFSDNTQSVLGNNYSEDIYPILSNISKKAPIYWFSGSLGNAPSSFFYHKDKLKNITYIATAIRGLKRDAWLNMTVGIDKKPVFNTVSLTGQKMQPLEKYNVAFWNSTSTKAPFNYRLIPYYTKNILLHRAFWYGIGAVILSMLVIRLLKKKRRS